MSGTAMRILAVLELLQAYEKITGAEIAERLGIGTRSVRRYIKQIQEMGVPVEAERGPYGAYRLERGFRLPPLMFTEDEAVALTLGLMVMRAFQFPIDAVSMTGALAKVERVLPDALLSRTLALQEAIHFNIIPPSVAIQRSVMKTLTTAVQERQRLRVRYLPWQDSAEERITERVFDPYGIVFYEGWWYVVGYCHLRQDLRTFRIDRIQNLEPAGGTFTRPTDFDTPGYVMKSLNNPAGIRQVEVLFMTSLDEAKRALPAGFGTLDVVEEGVMFRRPAYRLEWVAPILLSLEFPIRIRQPDELKVMIRALAEKASRMADDL
jgi:predicted DNA-binding transcriptional regulator YafY